MLVKLPDAWDYQHLRFEIFFMTFRSIFMQMAVAPWAFTSSEYRTEGRIFKMGYLRKESLTSCAHMKLNFSFMAALILITVAYAWRLIYVSTLGNHLFLKMTVWCGFTGAFIIRHFFLNAVLSKWVEPGYSECAALCNATAREGRAMFEWKRCDFYRYVFARWTNESHCYSGQGISDTEARTRQNH